MVQTRLLKALAYLLLSASVLTPPLLLVSQSQFRLTDYFQWTALGILAFAILGLLIALSDGLRGLARQIEEHEE